MAEVMDDFDLQYATLKLNPAFEGEVLEVPVKPGRSARNHLAELARDLASFASGLTRRPYEIGESGIREPDTLAVHGPDLPAHGFKLVVYGDRILIGPASALADKTLLPSYLSYLNRLEGESRAPAPARDDLLEVPAFHTAGSKPKESESEETSGAAAYVLARIRMGKLLPAMEQIAKLNNVTSVKAVVGPYDVIARVSGRDQNEINRLIFEQFSKVDGVAETLTCTVVDLQSQG